MDYLALLDMEKLDLTERMKLVRAAVLADDHQTAHRVIAPAYKARSYGEKSKIDPSLLENLDLTKLKTLFAKMGDYQDRLGFISLHHFVDHPEDIDNALDIWPELEILYDAASKYEISMGNYHANSQLEGDSLSRLIGEKDRILRTWHEQIWEPEILEKRGQRNFSFVSDPVQSAQQLTAFIAREARLHKEKVTLSVSKVAFRNLLPYFLRSPVFSDYFATCQWSGSGKALQAHARLHLEYKGHQMPVDIYANLIQTRAETNTGLERLWRKTAACEGLPIGAKNISTLSDGYSVPKIKDAVPLSDLSRLFGIVACEHKEVNTYQYGQGSSYGRGSKDPLYEIDQCRRCRACFGWRETKENDARFAHAQKLLQIIENTPVLV